MSLYFITGTDTECGKTTATSLLAEHFTKQNKNTITQKWIQTGAAENHNDIDEHLKYLKLSKQEHDMFLKHMCPYKFKLASSAHLAAKKENIEINIATILESVEILKENFKTVLIEGLGGICVPINNTQTTLDILTHINAKIIIVVQNKLGCINHSLLTANAIKQANLNCVGFILNNKEINLDPVIAKDTPEIIQSQTNLPLLAEISNKKVLTIKSKLLYT